MTALSLHEEGPEPKRRKVRKGTQSCWECRRRKVSCTFAASTDAICDNCRRRKRPCISQEQPDIPLPVNNCDGQTQERLSRVEELLEHLINGAVNTKGLSRDQSRRTRISAPEQVLIPSKSAHHAEPPSEQPLMAAATFSNPGMQALSDKYGEIRDALIAAWPSQDDIDTICNLPVGLSVHIHIGICTPYSSSMVWNPPKPRDMLQLPPPGSHPVLIARKLLILGTYLQGVVPSAIRDLPHLRKIMSRVIDAAVNLVTTNDELINSVEGIECIMIESMYQNYAGNLHRAWKATRRAITVAQLMALHRGLNSPSMTILEAETQANFDPDQICFRLVQMDDYLSLMLGLPWTSLEARFATPKALEGCQPIDRMQRIHSAMARRILQREPSDLTETRSIDTLLQKAATEMTPQWWLVSNFSTSSSGGVEGFHETIRVMDQLTHYQLLLQLHLPYMLRSSPDHRYDHSKLTAVTASRETLVRFVAFRTSNTAHFYCRGTDFLAFIATTVLCLAHTDSRSQPQSPVHNLNIGTSFNFFAHSRPNDRGLMERTLEIIDSMTQSGTDVIACKIARILRPLLAIEASAASGIKYSTSFSTGDEEELECHGKLTNSGKAVHVYIPSFGTINFERRIDSNHVSCTTSATDILLPGQTAQHSQPTSYIPNAQSAGQIGDESSFDISNIQESQSLFPMGNTGTEDDWDLQGIDVTLFNSLFRDAAIPDVVDETWAQWASIGD